MKSKNFYAQYFAEFIGTFFLVFFGCGSVILAEINPGFDGGFIPIVFGGAVSIMIYATGHISGAHFNPAVTIGFWSTRRFPLSKVCGYILAQCGGGILASCVHKIIFTEVHGYGATLINSSTLSGFIMEMILSFSLMFVIISVATDSRAVGELAGIAIGSTVAVCAFVGGPITGASMNPARTLAPALLSGEFSLFWIYLFAPILGTVLGAKTYEWIRCNQDGETTKGPTGCC